MLVETEANNPILKAIISKKIHQKKSNLGLQPRPLVSIVYVFGSLLSASFLTR
jgi:hypothetical protein